MVVGLVWFGSGRHQRRQGEDSTHSGFVHTFLNVFVRFFFLRILCFLLDAQRFCGRDATYVTR
jgi:hypothetical protein